MRAVYPYWPLQQQPSYPYTAGAAAVLTPFRCSAFCLDCSMTFEVSGITPDAAEAAVQAWRDSHTDRCTAAPAAAS